MKNLLAHLEQSPVLDSVLTCALLTAQRFGSRIEGLHQRPGQPDVIAAGADGFVAAAPDLVAGFEREARERSERARATFETFMRTHGVADTAEAGPDAISASWRVESADGQTAFGSIGRIFDLLVIGRPSKSAVSPSMAALETALFESGRPLLIAPPTPPTVIGEHIMISWNCSSETALTVALAMPFLKQARKVTVLVAEKGVVPGPSGRDLARNLVRHGLDVENIDVPSDERGAGEVTLSEAARAGADLLIKGAYTQSRLRQMIFGGATSHILVSAELPVFMAN